MLGTELLEDDVNLKHGDMLTLVIDTVLYERVALNYTQTAQFMYNLHDLKYQQDVSWKNALNQLIMYHINMPLFEAFTTTPMTGSIVLLIQIVRQTKC